VAELISAYPPGIWLILLATGLVIGVLAGLLGVGGGVIAVPILLEVFDALGMAEAPAISLAVGTAQATILATSLTAATAHWRADTIDWSLVRNWTPSLIVGIAVGLILASCAPVNLLTSLFAAAAAGLALKWQLVTDSSSREHRREVFFLTSRRLRSVAWRPPWAWVAEL
jgi:uncharacterized membrane protein YfcA